jgi:hypothetical protein
VSNDVTGAAEGLIPVAAVLIPLVQSLWTRAAVFSPKTFQETVGKHAAGLSNGPACLTVCCPSIPPSLPWSAPSPTC